MEKADLISRIDQLKEKEKKITGRLKRLLHVVSHSLNYRKEAYLELKYEFTKLVNNKGEAQEKFKTLEKNLLIYEKNLEKIEALMKKNYIETASIKKKYDSLLTGPVSNVIEYAGECPSITPINETDDENVYMLLKLRKQSLMDSMDTIFQRYEDDIDKMEKGKKGLIEKRDAIMGKKKEAVHQRELILAALESYGDEIHRVRELLHNRREELKTVFFIYEGIVRKIQASSSLHKKIRPALLQGIAAFED